MWWQPLKSVDAELGDKFCLGFFWRSDAADISDRDRCDSGRSGLGEHYKARKFPLSYNRAERR